jgi:cytochrome oxidase Cu insertion factor (SCO1/SenC/PrrC family)
MTLHKLNKAIEKIKKMPEARFFNLKALFISVDPDRDNSKKIKE